jgi:hypothetical protein
MRIITSLWRTMIPRASLTPCNAKRIWEAATGEEVRSRKLEAPQLLCNLYSANNPFRINVLERTMCSILMKTRVLLKERGGGWGL